MKKALIHIGTGKTGTTTIQQALSNANLDHLNIQYPISRIFKNNKEQNFLSIIYQHYDKLPRGYQSKFINNELNYSITKASLEEEIKSFYSKDGDLIISGEFLTNFNKSSIERFLIDLMNFGYEQFKVLVFVRNPVTYYTSCVEQLIKASHIIPNPNSFKYNFKDQIVTWHQIFDNTRVLLYDNIVYDQGLINSFEKECQEFFKKNRKLERLDRNSNTSMSLEALWILKKYREINYEQSKNVFKKDSNYLLKSLQELKNVNQTPLNLKEEVKQVILNNHSEELIWLENNFVCKFRNLVLSDSRVKKVEFSNRISELFNNCDVDKLLSTYSLVIKEMIRSLFKEMDK